MEAPPSSSNSIPQDSGIKMEPNETDDGIDDEILDFLIVPNSNSSEGSVTVSSIGIVMAFKKLLRRIKILEEQVASCMETQPLIHQAIGKCSALEDRVKAIEENVDPPQGAGNEQAQNHPHGPHLSEAPLTSEPAQKRSRTSTKREAEQVEPTSEQHANDHDQPQDQARKRDGSTNRAEENSDENADISDPEENQQHVNNSREKQKRVENPNKCKLCGNLFVNLGQHMKTHTGEKPFPCSVCDRRFSQRGNLKTHERIHNGQRPYKCGICDLAFYQAPHLKAHERTHSAERPYKCQYCDSSFKQRSARVHHEMIHTNHKPHACQSCNKSFKSLFELKAHSSKKHSQRP